MAITAIPRVVGNNAAVDLALAWDTWDMRVGASITSVLLALRRNPQLAGMRVGAHATDTEALQRRLAALGIEFVPGNPGDIDTLALYHDEQKRLDIPGVSPQKIVWQFVGTRKAAPLRMTPGGKDYPVFKDRTHPLPLNTSPNNMMMPAHTGHTVLPFWLIN